MIFAKFMDGQKISGYTNKDSIFTGYVKSMNENVFVVSEDGKKIKLSELKKIKYVGKVLHEEAEKEWAEELKKFGDYYTGTFDTEKVEKAPDNVKDKIIKQFTDTSKSGLVKQHGDEFSKEAKNIINQKTAEEQIDAGSLSVDQAIEKLKKTENLFSNQDIQKSILNEREQDWGDGTVEDLVPDWKRNKLKYNKLYDPTSEESREKSISAAMIDNDMSREEAEEFLEFISKDLEWKENHIQEEKSQEEDPYWQNWDKLSEQVDSEFESALDEITESDVYGSKAIVEAMAQKFGGDAEKALKETTNIPDAILNLADQVKMIRMNDIRSKERK